MSSEPYHIVIVGRDAALWLTATVLSKAFRTTGIKVTAVELPSRLGPGSTYAALPALESLHAKIGIEEADLLRGTGGSFSAGWNVVPVGKPPFLLAHGSYGAPIDGKDFFGYWVKAKRFGLDASFENFSPTAMAGRHGRILIPDDETELFGRTDYAYHLPAIAYCGLLKSRALKLGVTLYQAMDVGVERDGVGGGIRSVNPDGCSFITGDLFIDASGPDGALIGGLGIAAEDWRDFFPFDRVLKASGQRYSAVPAYTELRLGADSCAALMGTQVAAHVVQVFADDGTGPEAATVRAAQTAGLTLSDIAVSASTPGIRAAAWSENCVAIGTAACVFDPLLDFELHSIQLGIVHLLSLFPASGETVPERAEFNRISRSLFERLRDFQAALYGLAKISSAIPLSLQQKLAIFLARGNIAPMEDETFTPDQWRALFVGLGMMPETWPPGIDTTRPEEIKAGFRRILRFVHDKVLEQPVQDQYLADIGARGRS